MPLTGIGTNDSPHCPDKSRPGFESWQGKGLDGKAGSDTLVIHHNGHGPCNGGEPQRDRDCTDCTPNFDTAQDWLNQLGYDVMEVFMPFHGCNRIPANETCSEKHCVSNKERGFDCAKCVPQGETDSMSGSHQCKCRTFSHALAHSSWWMASQASFVAQPSCLTRPLCTTLSR